MGTLDNKYLHYKNPDCLAEVCVNNKETGAIAFYGATRPIFPTTFCNVSEQGA